MMFRIVIIVFGIMFGCSVEHDIQYPGAPIITIKQTSWEPQQQGQDYPMRLRYRLESNEPLPYDIRVKLAIQGTCTIHGKEYKFGDEISKKMKQDRFIYQSSYSERSIFL